MVRSEMLHADQPVSAAMQAKLREGLRFHQQGRLVDAERLYAEVLQQEPASVDALHLLGVVAVQSHQIDRGIDLLTKAIGLNPNSAPPYNDLGKVLSALERHEQALASFERAIALEPDFAAAHNNRGNALNALKRHVEAIASHEKAIALRPDFPAAHRDRDDALADLLQWNLLRLYKEKLGTLPRLHPPRTFNERITHRIIYDRDPRLKIICDKLRVRQFISERVGSQYVVPLLGAWEDPGKIPWDRLPEQFVLKPSRLSGPYVIFVKSTGTDIAKLTAEAEAWLRRDYFDASLEWGYRGMPRGAAVAVAGRWQASRSSCVHVFGKGGIATSARGPQGDARPTPSLVRCNGAPRGDCDRNSALARFRVDRT